MEEERNSILEALGERLELLCDFETVPSESTPLVDDRQATEEAEAFSSEGRYEDVEIKRREAETSVIVETNLDRRVNRNLRWGYAKKVYCYLVVYSGVVGLLLVLHGVSAIPFTLHESVLNFLVGSTAAAAIGLVYAVTNGLFGSLKQ